jgi:hypothetical protein
MNKFIKINVGLMEIISMDMVNKKYIKWRRYYMALGYNALTIIL